MKIETLRKLKGAKSLTPQIQERVKRSLKRCEEKIALMKKILKKSVV